jgi:hypothetical protein
MRCEYGDEVNERQRNEWHGAGRPLLHVLAVETAFMP